MNALVLTPLLALAMAAPALAQQQTAAGAARTAVAAAPAAAEMTEGQVRSIDKATGKITIAHGEIKNLGMPPMTMAFRVTSIELLDKVKVGEKIRFRAETSPTGTLLVSDIQPATAKP